MDEFVVWILSLLVFGWTKHSVVDDYSLGDWNLSFLARCWEKNNSVTLQCVCSDFLFTIWQFFLSCSGSLSGHPPSPGGWAPTRPQTSRWAGSSSRTKPNPLCIFWFEWRQMCLCTNAGSYLLWTLNEALEVCQFWTYSSCWLCQIFLILVNTCLIGDSHSCFPIQVCWGLGTPWDGLT